jgi:CheY-like chemotaxis protein
MRDQAKVKLEVDSTAKSPSTPENARNRLFYHQDNYPPARECTPPFVDNQIKVLIVEDSATDLRIIEKLIPKIPYTVTLTKDGQEAVNYINLKMFNNPGEIPNIIFMDQEMPKLKGDAASKRINNFLIKRGLSRIPIISISNHIYSLDELKAKGMDGQIGKKLTSILIIETVKKYINPSLTTSRRSSDEFSYIYNAQLIFYRDNSRKKMTSSLEIKSLSAIEIMGNKPSSPCI